jgi:hypothetical protein
MPDIHTLRDDFATDQLASLWPNTYGTVTVTGGRAAVECSTGYSGLHSAATYTPAGSSVHARLTPPLASTAATAYVEMKIAHTVAGTEIVTSIDAATGLVTCSNSVSYFDAGATSEPYSPTRHAYVRIRESGGELRWERSADSRIWHTMRTAVTPAWVASSTTASILIQAHRDAGTIDEAFVGDVNIDAVRLEILYGGEWRDVARDGEVFADQPIRVTRGDGAESASLRPASLSARLDNRGDKYRISNPTSPLYGVAGRNTPMRLYVGSHVRAYVEASAWKAGRTPDFLGSASRGRAWVDVEGGGLLRRIGQWTEPLRSPMTRGASKIAGLYGHWPLEDDSSASVLTQTVPGAPTGTYVGDVTLGSDIRPDGAARTAVLGAGGVLRGLFASSSGSGWQISFAYKLPAVPGSTTREVIFRWTDTLGRVWTWEASSSTRATVVTAADGTVLMSSSSTYGSVQPDEWLRVRVHVTVSGSTVTVENGWHNEPATTVIGLAGTFTGTSTGQLVSWDATQGPYTSGAAYTCVLGTNDTSVDLILDPYILAQFRGYRDERAGQRYSRLMTEAGLPWGALGSAGSERMGPQPEGPLLDLIRECRDTDDALVYDARHGAHATFRARNRRYPTGSEPTFAAEDLVVLPDEVTDDLGVANLVTVVDATGVEETREATTGPLSTQPPPDGVGTYERRHDVNVIDPALRVGELAGYWLERGTVEAPRFPQVTFQLDRDAGFASGAGTREAVLDLDIGSVFYLSGVAEDDVALYVIGYDESIAWPKGHFITFTCAPLGPFAAGVYDSTEYRYDLRTSTLDGDHSAAATSLDLTIVDDESWSTTDPPYDLLISGERVTVTAMSARTGSGPYAQTATVTRNVNGVTKALPDGAEVHVATPGRWGM